jgi:hypothetical protein
VSDVDRLTILPRKDPSVYLFSDPVLAGTQVLKQYNQITRQATVIPQNHPDYGWSIQEMPIIADLPQLGSVIAATFNQPQKSLQTIWRLSYQVAAANCIKCNSSGVVSDWTYLADPDKALYVRYESKLAQDFLKFLLTPAGSDPYYPWMGTIIPDLPGSKFDMRDLEAKVIAQVSATADKIKSLQKQQAQISTQSVDPREMLDSVASVVVQQSQVDARMLIIRIELYTVGKTLTTVQFPFRR